jgi:PAS domain-containing protein
MSKEMILFDKDELTLKERFYRLMDLLVSNKSSSRFECQIFFGIFFLQLLTGFYDPFVGVLDKNYSDSDNILDIIHNVLRLKGLFKDNYSSFRLIIILLLVALVIVCIGFLLILKNQKKVSIYTYKEFALNFAIKVFLYILFNPILDLCLTTVCFETYNPNFLGTTCAVGDHAMEFFFAFVLFVLSIFLAFAINLYYNDSYFLSGSYYSRMNCSYEIYMTLHCIVYSILLNQAKYLGKEIFLIYNFIISLIFLGFYFGKFFFYDQGTNALVGLFTILFSWTSLYFLIIAFVNMDEKAVVYLAGCIIVILLFYNLHIRLQEYIILQTPFHKITNKYHIMFYLKNLIDKINSIENSGEAKAILVGIIQHHSIECPTPNCITKHKKKLYLPSTEEWSNRDKHEITDRVFLLNLVIVIMNYFIGQNYINPEMLINLSFYYLNIIGNHCMAIFYYTKLKDMKLSIEDNFAFIRLSFAIGKSLVEKLKPANEPNQNMVDINVSYYYKYDYLSQRFFDEISNDINLSLEFWKILKTHHETGRQLDFTKIFQLTDKIRLTKQRIDKLWNDLYNTYSGVNDIFALYENYIEQINDDDMLKRDLEAIKSKNPASSDLMITNIYQLIFSKDTGVIILNGDKGKEGIIEKINQDAELIFNYKSDEVKGVNITAVMPKMFEKIHRGFLERFFDVGEKKRVDKSFKSFGKDRDFQLLYLKLYVKVLPMLNESIFYCGMATKEPTDDIVLIDAKYNIQAFTNKLMQRFEITNKNIFQETDIPFYVICRQFLHFYKIFLKGNRNRRGRSKKKSFVSTTGGDNMFSTANMSGTNLTSMQQKSSNALGASGEQDTMGETKNQSQVMEGDDTSGIGAMGNSAGISATKLIEEVMGDGEPMGDANEFESNENLELEYEIQIPMFLRDYMEFLNKKATNKKSNKADTTGEEVKEENEEKEFDESDGLVNNDETKGGETEGGDPANKQSDEDKEFQMKIRHCKSLFDMGKLDELEDFIKRTNEERPTKEYKFNFTFEKHAFGNRGMSYFIRCIDNKADFEDSQSNNISIVGNGNEKAMAGRHQKNKVETLKDFSEVTVQDKNEMGEKLNEYTKLLSEGGEFTRNLATFRNEMMTTSKIFGVRKEDQTMDDENSSSSSSAFNDNAAKKARIEEIRSNIMNNVSSFYTIKLIKGIFYFVIALTAAFCGIYLMIFDIIHDDLSNISNLNIGMYQTTIWISNIISTLVSLRSTYKFNLENYRIKYNSYITDQLMYYNTLSNFTDTWYQNVITNFGPLEKQINLYFVSESTTDMFWNQGPITYPTVKMTIKDTESLTMTLSQVLSDTNQLLQNPYFTNNPSVKNNTGLDKHMKSLINYSTFLSIENAIDNLLPRMFQMLNAAPDIFFTENNGNMNYVILIVLGYTFTILLMIVGYAILLYLTNKNMEEGLEKVSKIRLEKIDETIKKIDSFNEKSLSKFRQKEGKSAQEEVKEVKEEQSSSNNNAHLKDYNKIFSEGQKFKRLNVLSYSYLQIIIIFVLCCVNLIPIYLVSLSMIDNSNQIIKVQDYILGKCLASSSSTVAIKCVISQCQNSVPLTNNVVLPERSTIEGTIRDMTDFTALTDFYSNKFLLDACGAIYDSTDNSTTSKYSTCLKDDLIKSSNNTDNLLKLIDETVATIIKDKEIKTGKSYMLYDNTTVAFSNPLLFESKSFMELEYIFYNYITPISDAFSSVISVSFEDYLDSVKVKIIILICVFVLSILVFSFYIAFIYTRKLVQLLSVSRVIFRIIPTMVIINTPELEVWIESK